MSYFIYHPSNRKDCPNFECDVSLSANCYDIDCECSCSHCILYNECAKDYDDMMKHDF